jgi:hypothetical protein
VAGRWAGEDPARFGSAARASTPAEDRAFLHSAARAASTQSRRTESPAPVAATAGPVHTPRRWRSAQAEARRRSRCSRSRADAASRRAVDPADSTARESSAEAAHHRMQTAVSLPRRRSSAPRFAILPGSSDRSTTRSFHGTAERMSCVGFSSLLAKSVRHTSWRRTISLRVRSSASVSSGPVWRMVSASLHRSFRRKLREEPQLLFARTRGDGSPAGRRGMASMAGSRLSSRQVLRSMAGRRSADGVGSPIRRSLATRSSPRPRFGRQTRGSARS